MGDVLILRSRSDELLRQLLDMTHDEGFAEPPPAEILLHHWRTREDHFIAMPPVEDRFEFKTIAPVASIGDIEEALKSVAAAVALPPRRKHGKRAQRARGKPWR